MGTILVVDDDGHIREFLRKSCESLATVIEAADGAQALAAARWSHPDVVVMDLDMPVIDGFEAARQLKCDPTLGDPVLVALTGNETANAVPRARAAGYSYFVRKETNARSFVETIVRLLEEAQQRAAGARAPLAPPAVSEAAPAPARRARGSRATAAAPKQAKAGAKAARSKQAKAKPARAKAAKSKQAKAGPSRAKTAKAAGKQAATAPGSRRRSASSPRARR